MLVPPQECKDINLLVTGYVGSGKSSLVNTFLTVLRNTGSISTMMAHRYNAHRKYASPIVSRYFFIYFFFLVEI